MYSSAALNSSTLESFKLSGMMMRYSVFVPRLYNYCLSLGFTQGKIMPSRAFCSDESQGFPTILLAKHFGAYPFNHGRVGGVVANGRHAPHAHHGQDLLLVQASHVGYDPETKSFGTYRRFQTEGACLSTNCGKILQTLAWYHEEYVLAKANIYLEVVNGRYYVVIDKDLLRADRTQGLMLHMDKFVDANIRPDKSFSTSSRFLVSDEFLSLLGEAAWVQDQRTPIGENLHAELFYFRRTIAEDIEGGARLEKNLFDAMPWILTSEHAPLTAAKVNSQAEFDRTYRTILREPSYQNKNLLFIAGIHIDISPKPSQVFPLTKFIPWAAYHQTREGESRILEQHEIAERLSEQSTDNQAEINLEEAIKKMEDEQEVRLDAE